MKFKSECFCAELHFVLLYAVYKFFTPYWNAWICCILPICQFIPNEMFNKWIELRRDKVLQCPYARDLLIALNSQEITWVGYVLYSRGLLHHTFMYISPCQSLIAQKLWPVNKGSIPLTDFFSFHLCFHLKLTTHAKAYATILLIYKKSNPPELSFPSEHMTIRRDKFCSQMTKLFCLHIYTWLIRAYMYMRCYQKGIHFISWNIPYLDTGTATVILSETQVWGITTD